MSFFSYLAKGILPTKAVIERTEKRKTDSTGKKGEMPSPTATSASRKRTISVRLKDRVVVPEEVVGEDAARIKAEGNAVAPGQRIPYMQPPADATAILGALHQRPSPKPSRLRGVSFKQEYLAAMAAEMGGGARARTRDRAPTMLSDSTTRAMVPPRPAMIDNALTVVLDLDETLMYARDGPLFTRPYLTEFLAYIGSCCEVVVWTAGIRPYAKCVVKEIDPHGVISHCIYRHHKWFAGADYTKELAVLGRPLDRTLIIENTPTCVNANYLNGIIVEDFEHQDGKVAREDVTLLAVMSFIESLLKSQMPVPQFIAQCADLELMVADGTMFYFLRSDASSMKTIKANRDKLAVLSAPKTSPRNTAGFVLRKEGDDDEDA